MAGINDIIFQTYARRPLLDGIDRGMQSVGGMAMDARRARFAQERALEDERRAYELRLRALEGQLGVPLAGEEVRTSLPESFDALAGVYNDALAGRQAALDEATGIEAVLAQMPDAPGAEESRAALVPHLMTARAAEGDRLKEARGLEGVLRQMQKLPSSYLTGVDRPTAMQSAEGIGRGQALLDQRKAQQAAEAADADAQRDLALEQMKASLKASQRSGDLDTAKFQEGLVKDYEKRVADPLAAVDQFMRLRAKLINPETGDVDFNNVSGFGDIALVFDSMKNLDPRSVVRDSEFETAQSASGLITKIATFIEQLSSGRRLSPQQRADMYEVARRMARHSRSLAERARAEELQRWSNITETHGVPLDARNLPTLPAVDLDVRGVRGQPAPVAPVKGRIE